MRVVLTGASSFVGGHVTRRLAEAGHDVVATYRRSRPGALVELAARPGLRLTLVPVDLADRHGFEALGPADAIVHVAGVSAADGVSGDEILACNVEGARNLIAYAQAAGAGRIVYASTLSVHGAISDPEVDERTPVRDPDVYGASKHLAERLFAEAAGRLPCVAIRLPGVLGPGAHRAWLPTMADRALAGEPIRIFNPDAPFNNAAHVDDLGAFMAALVAGDWAGFSAFPVGAGESMAVRAVAERVVERLDSSSRIEVGPARATHFSISSRAARSLGYRPMPMSEMLDRFLAERRPEARVRRAARASVG